MTTKKKIRLIQTTIIVFLWLILLAIPLLFGADSEKNWSSVPKIWIEYSWIFGLFLINRFILMPYLFFRKKHITYFVVVGGLVLSLFLGMYLEQGYRQSQFKP